MVSRNLSGRLHGRSGHIRSQTVLLEESGVLSFHITYPSHSGLQVPQYINKTTKSVYTGGTLIGLRQWVQFNAKQVHLGVIRSLTQRTVIDSGALRKEVVKYGPTQTDSSWWYTESHRTDGHLGWSTTDRSGEICGT